MNSLLPAMVSAVGWALLHFIWQGLLIGWGVTLAMHLLRKARPQTRYAVACGGMLLCAALPLSSIIIQLADLHAAGGFGTVQTVAVSGAGDAAASLFSESALDGVKDLLRRQLPWIVGLWLAGAALMALRLAIGLKWVADHTRADQYSTNPYWQRRLSELARRFDIEFHVRLGVADKLDSPITAGCWKPIVLVPAALITGMPADLLEALLAHELAHIKRHDYLVNLIQSTIEIGLFYHPSVWALSRRIRIEREQIADDLAVSMLGQPQKLAQALSQLDRFQFDTTQLAHAAHGGNLMSRIKRLLRPDVEPVSWKLAMPLAGLLAASAMFYAHAAPQPPAPPSAPAAPMAAELPATPAVPAVPEVADVPEASDAPEPIAPVAAVEPVAPVAPVAPVGPVAAVAPVAPVAPMTELAAPAAAPVPALPVLSAISAKVSMAGDGAVTRIKSDRFTSDYPTRQRGAYAIVHAGSDSMTVSANTADIRKVAQLRATMRDDFLWFRDGDKTYVIKDPAMLARLDEAWTPVNRIGSQMEEQGKKMDAQGKIMSEIGKQMGVLAAQIGKQAERSTESQQREIERLGRAEEKIARRIADAARDMADDRSPEKIRALQAQQVRLQAEMAPLQQQIAQRQSELSTKISKLHEQDGPMKALHEKMDAAGRPMGEMSGRMGELSAKHADAVREAERTMQALMQESLQNGKAVPAPSA